jgi:predicted PurR-regulated permease PerM
MAAQNQKVAQHSFKGPTMARVISLVILTVLVLLFGVLFFRVMAGFIVPLFLAVLLAVLFRPLHSWIVARSHGYVRTAALVTTIAVLLIIFIPVLLLTLRAATEAYNLVRDPDRVPVNAETIGRGVEWFNEQFGTRLTVEQIKSTGIAEAKEVLLPVAEGTPGFVGKLLLGLAIMSLALYYFLADGPHMLAAVGDMLPLESGHQRRLIDEFASISRAVALATILSALAQAILAGIGYYFAGVGSVLLLTMLTFLGGMIPFVGATIVWLPASLWLYFVQGQTVAAIVLAIWCALVVSMVDNLIKPLVLHGQSNLHPLLALLSVLGGVQALGAIGIFVGPMAVVFLQAGLKMLNAELATFKSPAATNVPVKRA